jgi:hypothetical protein
VPNICVVHLVRKKNGIEPFQCFLESYLKHPAGIDHDLLILYKGFAHQADIATYEELLIGVHHSILTIADFGFDLRAYFIAADKTDSEYLCFLNSFSVLLDDDWLLKLYRHISKSGVGLVGATGSWGSICPGRISSKKNRPLWKRLLLSLLWKLIQGYFELYFDHYPNYHIRTNGFIVARGTMLKIHRGLLFRKMHAYRLESGKNSITKQIERMGLKPVVVGKDGRGYDKQEWHISSTFWRDGQSNLLIADNQTRKYDTGDRDCQQRWEYFAWRGTAIDLQADTSGDA